MRTYLSSPMLIGFLCLFSSSAQSGEPTAVFLNETAGARSAALGNSLSADSQQAESFLANPAGLAWMEAPRVWLTHNESILNSKTETVGLALPIRASGVGVAARYFSEGTINRTAEDNAGDPVTDLGSFRPFTALTRLSAAHRIRQTSVGVGVSGWTQKIDQKSKSSWAMDAGLLHSFSPWASTALTRHNQGASVQGHPLPADWSAGLSVHPQLQRGRFVTVLTEIRAPDQGSSVLRGGIEFGVSSFALRIGHPDLLARNASDIFRFTLGAGVRVKGIQADYAWQDGNDLGQQHLFTLSFALGQTAAEKMSEARILDQAMTEKMSNRANLLIADGRAALDQGDFDHAIESYLQAITWEPSNAKAQQGLKIAQSARQKSNETSLRTNAELYMNQQEWIDAAATLRELQKISPDDTWAAAKIKVVAQRVKDTSASQLFEQGSQKYINSNYEGALHDWQSLLAAQPNYPLIREYIAKAQNKILEEKIKAQENGQTENPAEAMSRTAYIYYSLGKTDEAISLWQKVLVLDADNGDAKTALKNAQARLSLAQKDGLPDQQRISESFNQQALKQYSEGHRESAILLWKKALQLDPNNGRYKNNIQRVESEVATDAVSK